MMINIAKLPLPLHVYRLVEGSGEQDELEWRSSCYIYCIASLFVQVSALEWTYLGIAIICARLYLYSNTEGFSQARESAHIGVPGPCTADRPYMSPILLLW